MDPPQPLSSSNPPSGKLRLMCSYGGQIVPRPNGKSLCYTGGETRIVAVDRRSGAASVSALTNHISKTLLAGRSFCLKYQLPNHDLDSLVSVTTDEDLVNMIEEYDRLALSSSPSRLRFFLFPVNKPETNSGEYDARSEAWFFDSLRSARIDSGEKRSSGSSSGGEGQGDSGLGGSESIVLETNSSFGSTGSAASVSNLPAVKGGGGEEVGLLQVQDLKVNLPLLDTVSSDASSFASSTFQSPTLVYADSLDQSETKDTKLATKLIETETNSVEVSPHADMFKPMQVYGYSLSQPMEQLQQQSPTLKQPVLQSQPQPQQTLQYLHSQPQYINAGSHYTTQYYPGAMQAGPYTTTTYHPFLHQQQQQQPTYAINKPYPVYVMQVGQPQSHSMASTAVVPPSANQMQPNPMMVTPKIVYDGFPPALSTPELAAATKAYRAGPVAAQPVPVPLEENKFMPVSTITPPAQTQSVPVSSVLEGAKYVGGVAEYDDPLHAQIYKTQPTNMSQLQLDNNKQQVRT